MAAYSPEQNHGYKSAVVSGREGAEGEVIMPAEFPVEIVNDDKFIIKPVMAPLYDEADAELYAHYPNAIGGWGEHDAQMLRPVVSEITFTRGWKSTASTSASAARQAECAKPRVACETWAPAVVKSLTPIKNVTVPTFEQQKMYILTEDMLNSSVKTYLDKKYNR